MRKLLLLSTLLFLVAYTSFAQNSVGIGTTAPNNNAVLHLHPTNAQGLLLPKLATVDTANFSSLGQPDKGLIFYDTLRNVIRYYTGSKWNVLLDSTELANDSLTAYSGLQLRNDTLMLGDTLWFDTQIEQNGNDFIVSGSSFQDKIAFGANAVHNFAKFYIYSDFGQRTLFVNAASSANSPVAVYGLADGIGPGATSWEQIGVRGTANHAGESEIYGLYGDVFRTGSFVNTTAGVFGKALIESSTGTAIGVFGDVSAKGASFPTDKVAVMGKAVNSAGAAGTLYGGKFTVDAGGATDTTYGLYVDNQSTGANIFDYAAVFLGGSVGIKEPNPLYSLEVGGVAAATNFIDKDNTFYFVDPSGSSSGRFAGNLRIGESSNADDDFIYFDQGAHYVKWNNTDAQFETNAFLAADRFVDLNNINYWIDPSSSVSGRLYGNLYIGDGSATDSDVLFFDAGNESITWDNTVGRFTFSDEILASGAVINGAAYFANTLYHYLDIDTYIGFALDEITFSAGNLQLLRLLEGTQDLVSIGNTGDVDISFNNNELYLSGSSPYLGFGSTAGLISHGANQRVLGIDAAVLTTDVDAPAVLEMQGSQEGNISGLLGRISFNNFANSQNYEVARIDVNRSNSNETYSELSFHTRLGGSLTEKMVITAEGEVGIGVNNPLAFVHIEGPAVGDVFRVRDDGFTRLMVHDDGTVSVGTNVDGAYDLYVSGTAYATGTWQSSDVRWKKDIQTINGALDKVNQLRGVTFNWRNKEFPARNFKEGSDLGFIAQEVEAVVPDLVNTDDDGYKAVSYSNMTALLLQAIKEQQAQIEALKNEKAELKGEVNTLKAEVNLIKQHVGMPVKANK